MRTLVTSVMVFATCFCFTAIQVEVDNLNQLSEIYKVEVKLTSFDDLQQPIQVIYNGNVLFYNNHNKDDKLLPVYLYTQSNKEEIRSSKDDTGIIVYASTTELNFLTSPDLNATDPAGGSGRQVSMTPAWSQLRSRTPFMFGLHPEVSVRCQYDEKCNTITFYFPPIYTSPFSNVLSTYTEYTYKSP
jgi:hypothetical protein